MIECLIDHGDSNLVHGRFIWQNSPDNKNSNIDYIIEIPDDYLKSYLERFIQDWSAGKVRVIFMNNNMSVPLFRKHLLQHLQQMKKSKQVTLANTKDTVLPKEHHGSGNTPLILTCYDGYTDMVHWLLHNDVDVDQWRDDGVTGLYMACQEGHNDIVKLLLERNPNVDLCDKDGFTPLIRACIRNYISIVQMLIKNKPNINAQTYDGGNALYFSALNGNIEIMQLLLENNADCNICGYKKQYVIDTITNHSWKTLENVKKNIYESLVKKASPHVADYISKKSVDFVFDVDAGSSPLHIACFMGKIDIVSCLLDHNADINMTKEDGSSPLCFACEVGHEDIVCLLLDKGADTQICRLDGESPLKIATDNGHASIEIVLKNHTKKEDKRSF
ncbi:ankyrin repeat domain-containing protein 29-like [Mytilus edulis]|uniref:ankyrin repeat domain-containing protein 29-like n=1 Tax=Mytilus edulis TaxID=6550 RepID=UPI0039EFA313